MPAKLSPKAFDLLCVLAESRPKAVEKETLMQRVWRDAFVSDGSLAVLVAELRTVLKDSATAPRIVRTVPRFGYAFCAQLIEHATAPANSPATRVAAQSIAKHPARVRRDDVRPRPHVRGDD